MFKRATQLVCSLTLLASSFVQADALIDALADEGRPTEQRLRDEYRHPQQTLRFFEVQEDMAVAEISPGGGWYSNILAPLLKDKGQFYAAHFYVDENTNEFYKKSREQFEQKITALKSYQNVKVTTFHQMKATDFAPAESLDRVLTFRNIHNWYMQDGDEGVENAFNAFYKALKVGGVLGVVEHSLRESQSSALQQSSGYMKQSYVIALAEKAGFTLAAKSDINANKLDSGEHEKGVWTLPPSLRLGEKDQAKYLNIGESNRMTLKFVK
ncbi:class I SAM-dependent methyltransferase [Paraglaciecola sp. L1A13]|uniref:class I SAM-dependent methyltransferase n=1 Tax=Paraglaciecola sp. L1A13 TaxID=2686359 RepID=UPI00131ECF52|nr:methyltransferase [Paraglaciecola sp. L1A13]